MMYPEASSRLPPGFICRAVNTEDLEPITAFLNACLRMTVGAHAHVHSVADLIRLTKLPGAELSTDFRVVTNRDGDIVGFANCMCKESCDVKSRVDDPAP